MKVRAPGKVLLTGAYAVLEGAPALVVAVDRYAEADPSRPAESPNAEVTEALGEHAPFCDATPLYCEGKKLGLGSSAAVLVASLGADAILRGKNLDDPDVRSEIFARARDAHARVQSGGSGVDVAASTYGGTLRYALHAGRPWVVHTVLPDDLLFAVYFSGKSARTSELRAKVLQAKASDPDGHRRHSIDLARTSEFAAETCEAGSSREFIAAVRLFAEALDRLGEFADAPIVPLSFKRLAVAASEEDAVFFPSGAGGGDVGVFLGKNTPSENFSKRAAVLGMQLLSVGIDRGGLRVSEAGS